MFEQPAVPKMRKEPRAWTPHPLGQEGAFWTPLRITFWQKKPQKSIFKVYFVTCSWKLQTINTYQHTFWSFLRPWRPKTAKNNQNMGPTCDSVAHQSAGRLKLAPPQPWSRAIPIITNFKNYAPPPNKKGGLQNLYAFRQLKCTQTGGGHPRTSADRSRLSWRPREPSPVIV